MCFYFGLPSEAPKISKRYQRKILWEEKFLPTIKYNGFAHPQNLIISCDNPTVIDYARWGLLPHWAHEMSFAKNTLNARIETIFELPSFKDCTQNRCLIPANFFYEWRHEGKHKIPYIIANSENDIFSFAGLFSDWKHPETNESMRTFTLLTTQASTVMRYIHNTKMRMPVVLKQIDEENWLAGKPIESFAYPYEAPLVGIPQ